MRRRPRVPLPPAAIEFLRLGAGSVVVGEGPGHQRDTYLVVIESGLDAQLRSQHIRFVDLNRDELANVTAGPNFTGFDHLWLPRTLLTSDIVVAMRKIKPHHWAGVTLRMKNMFGVVPDTRYGWPKNILHWRRDASQHPGHLLENAVHFVIADGIAAMEGSGPLRGTDRHLGKIVLSNDPVAADLSCARLTGLHPERVWHLDHAARFFGNAPLIGLCFSQRDYRNGLCRSMISHSSRTCGYRCHRTEAGDPYSRLGPWIFFGYGILRW